MVLLFKNLLFTVLVPGTVAVFLPWMIIRDCSAGSVWSVVAAVPVLAVGAAIYAWCVWDFATFGRGTPLPLDAPKRLVVHGLYRYTRNPMYVGVLTVILGWAIWFQSVRLVLYAAVVGTVFQLFILLHEEQHLLREFGSEYEAYRAEVGRWLPRRKRRTGGSLGRDA